MREITNGKLGAYLKYGGFLFDSPTVWKDLAVIGGADSALRISASDIKGEPAQTTVHSVSAVPGIIRNMSIIDVTRRA